jgi:uncharacterized protein DUF6174
MHGSVVDTSEDVGMRNQTYLLAAALLVSIACANASTATAQDATSAEAAWNAAGITDYTMSVKITGCMACGVPLEYSVTVSDGEVTEETSPSGFKDPEPMTVELLFDWLRPMSPDNLDATYNEVGVPIEAHVSSPPGVSDMQADYHVKFEQA